MHRLVFAILAHERLATIEDTISNINATCPNSEVLIFNGGQNSEWLQGGASVPVATRSRHVTWARQVDVAYELMVELRNRDDWDALVVFDSDMMILKSGYEEFLSSYLENFAYIGYEFEAYARQADTEPAHTASYQWPWWSSILECKTPYVVFNPGQVFRRDLCEFLVDDPRTTAVLDAVRDAHTFSSEELVWPSLAVGRGFPATANPGTHGMHMRRFDPSELTLLWADPSVFCVHKVGMDIDDPDRRQVHHLASSGATSDELHAAARHMDSVEIAFLSTRRRLRLQIRSVPHDIVNAVRKRPRMGVKK